MTEIIKEKLKTIKGFGTITKLEISSLITTIESQKEEIKSQFDVIVTNGKLINSQNEVIESLKAITELAVKGLKYVMTFPFLESTEDIRIIKRNCSDSLDEIERLQNE